MWFLNVLPDYVFHIITIAGVLGIIFAPFMGVIPFVSKYKLPVQLISMVVLLIGAFMEGAILSENTWQLKVKELEVKLAKAEAESQKENVKIVEKVVTKTRIIREREQQVNQYIDSELTKYDSQCVIPKEFVKVHNDSIGEVK